MGIKKAHRSGLRSSLCQAKREGLQTGFYLLLRSLLPYRNICRPWLPLKSASAPSMLPSSTIHDHYSETGQPSRYTQSGGTFPTASGGNYRQCAVLPSVRIVGVYSLTEKILYSVFELKVKNYFSQRWK